jgi:hypothetical protein
MSPSYGESLTTAGRAHAVSTTLAGQEALAASMYALTNSAATCGTIALP